MAKRKKAAPNKKTIPKKKVAKKAAPKDLLPKDLIAVAWRAWCDFENDWVGPWRTTEAEANQDAAPHIAANHTVEIRPKFD